MSRRKAVQAVTVLDSADGFARAIDESLKVRGSNGGHTTARPPTLPRHFAVRPPPPHPPPPPPPPP